MYKTIEEDVGTYCLECGEPIYGRSDKKFCGVACKNRWHRGSDTRLRNIMSPTLAALTSNYGILENLFLLDIHSCPLTRLEEMGFRQEYVTQKVEKNKKHLEYRCFDFIYCLSQSKLFNLRRISRD